MCISAFVIVLAKYINGHLALTGQIYAKSLEVFSYLQSVNLFGESVFM